MYKLFVLASIMSQNPLKLLLHRTCFVYLHDAPAKGTHLQTDL